MTFRRLCLIALSAAISNLSCASAKPTDKPVSGNTTQPASSATQTTETPASSASTLRSDDPDAVYQMRQMRLSEWIDKAKRDCERMRNTEAWLPEREGFLPNEIDLVKTKCAQAVEVGMRGDAWINAMRTCSQRFVQANGKGKHECRLSPKDVPDVPPEMFSQHKTACSVACARAGVEEIELKKERTQFVHCCDGTTSPTCTYQSLHKGCCSGHQGVCIE